MGIFDFFKKKRNKSANMRLSPELQKYLDEYNKMLFPGGHEEIMGHIVKLANVISDKRITAKEVIFLPECYK